MEQKKIEQPAYVVHGHSVVTSKGIAHEGAKLTWTNMEGINNDAKKRVFKKFIDRGFLERIPTPGEIDAADAAGQLGFVTDADHLVEAPEEEAPEEEAPEEEAPEEGVKKTGRKSGAQRRRR